MGDRRKGMVLEGPRIAGELAPACSYQLEGQGECSAVLSLGFWISNMGLTMVLAFYNCCTSKQVNICFIIGPGTG